MMGLKNKEENSTGGLHNALSTGTSVTGTISTETDFRIDGVINGDINSSGKIVVGAQGRVVGNIVANNVEILGYTEGNIEVKDRLVLKTTARIKGDVTTQVLEIEPGAQFNGTCKMSEKKKEVPSK